MKSLFEQTLFVSFIGETQNKYEAYSFKFSVSVCFTFLTVKHHLRDVIVGP